MTDVDERSLIQQAQHDPLAFASLYDRYIDRIYAYALRRTGDYQRAQDVTSATFEKALRHIRRYRWQGQSFCAWLYRIARNEMVAIQRNQRFLVPFWPRHTGEATMESIVEARQQSDQVQEAMAHLTLTDREVLMLRYYDDLSNSDIALVLSCSVESLYVRMHRALGRLRKELEKVEQVTGKVIQGE